ncbi:MAG: GFA family protein [Burkholderiales bacterium]
MNSPIKLPITGGCAFGKLRFEANALPIDVAYCHCKICQRTTGAPVSAFASFHFKDFRYTPGTPAIYDSSGISKDAPRGASLLIWRRGRDCGCLALREPAIFCSMLQKTVCALRRKNVQASLLA